MTAQRVRTDYEQLNQIARAFGSRAESTQALLQALRQDMQTLKGGDWVGQGADKFYAEMEQALLPAMKRLADAFGAAQKTSVQIGRVMKEAEEAAAAVLNGKAEAGAMGEGGNGSAFLAGQSGAGGGALAGASGFFGKDTLEAVKPGTSGSKSADDLARQAQDILNRMSKGGGGKNGSGGGNEHYRLASKDIIMNPKIEAKVAELAEAYYRRTGKQLVVNSGVRTPEKQADAMFVKLQSNDPQFDGLYKGPGREVRQAYEDGIRAGKSPSEIKADMAGVIKKQMQNDTYISPHLRGDAFDIQNKYMSAAEKKAFLEAAREVGGLRVKRETTPPHYHLTITD